MLSRLLPPVRLEWEQGSQATSYHGCGNTIGRKWTVNRTFGAFGILLGLLVLATLGVSSSSRSTQVRTIPVKAIPKQARRCGGSTYVIVLPASKPTATTCQIAPAHIQIAADVPAFDQSIEPMDCRWHGDAAYDYAVYGEQGAAAPLITAKSAAIEDRALTADELVGIFHALARIRPTKRWQVSKLNGWFSGHPRLYLLGLRNWALRQLERVPFSWLVASVASRQAPDMASIAWSDYLTFAESVTTLPPPPQPAKVELAAEGHVQSGHWLLHSAASSLNRLALVLQAAADRLEPPAEYASAH